MKISLPQTQQRNRSAGKKSGSKNKSRRSNSRKSGHGRSLSNGSNSMNKGFPTTPRSIEKQKKTLIHKLKKVMEDNMRLHAHNRTLNDKN